MAEDKGKVKVHLIGNLHHEGEWHYGDPEGKKTLTMDRKRAEEHRAAGTVRFAHDEPRRVAAMSHLQRTGLPNPEPEPEPDPVTGVISPPPGAGAVERPEVGRHLVETEPGAMAPEVAEPDPDTGLVAPAPGQGLPPAPGQMEDPGTQARRTVTEHKAPDDRRQDRGRYHDHRGGKRR